MSRLFDKIFNANGHISKEQLKAYFEDKLTDKERNEIEQLLIDSDFEKEAFEGFEDSPQSIKSLDRLSHTFETSTTQKPYTPWILSGVAASIAIIIGLLWMNNDTTLDNSLAENIGLQKEDKKQVVAPSSITDSILSEGNMTKHQEEDIPVLSDDKAIKQDKPDKNQFKKKSKNITKKLPEKQPIENPKVAPTIANTSNSTPELISETTEELTQEDIISNEYDLEKNTNLGKVKELKIVEQPDKYFTQESSSRNANSRSIAFKNKSISSATDSTYLLNMVSNQSTFIQEDIGYIHSYKVIKYSFRKNDLAEQEKILSRKDSKRAIQSRYEDRDQKEELSKAIHQDDVTKYEDYQIVLRKAIKAYKKENYKMALSTFEAILATFPDDVNALFYGGMSLSKLNKYESAIVWFDKALINSKITFKSESEWYKALALEKTGKQKQALKHYIEISQYQHHPFKEKARQKILSLEKK